MSAKHLKKLVSVAAGLESKVRGAGVRSSLVFDNGTNAVFRSSIIGAKSHYESTSSVKAKPIPKERWLAKIP